MNFISCYDKCLLGQLPNDLTNLVMLEILILYHPEPAQASFSHLDRTCKLALQEATNWLQVSL